LARSARRVSARLSGREPADMTAVRGSQPSGVVDYPPADAPGATPEVGRAHLARGATLRSGGAAYRRPPPDAANPS